MISKPSGSLAGFMVACMGGIQALLYLYGVQLTARIYFFIELSEKRLKPRPCCIHQEASKVTSQAVPKPNMRMKIRAFWLSPIEHISTAPPRLNSHPFTDSFCPPRPAKSSTSHQISQPRRKRETCQHTIDATSPFSKTNHELRNGQLHA